MKNLGIIVSILIAVGACVSAFTYNQKSAKSQGYLDKERYLRMTAEEEINVLQEKVTSLESDLDRSQKKIKGIQAKIEQLTAINTDLKSRLDKAAQIKENLESKLKELQQLTGGSIMVPVSVMDGL
ncbi:MAG: hypothetical protein KC684_08265 [Candidatus Omnitrophica bacterium]|nr:hypothetical protein [Candidatus Omnitrophota bacterium]